VAGKEPRTPPPRSPYLRGRRAAPRVRLPLLWLAGGVVALALLVLVLGENGLVAYLRLARERDRLQDHVQDLAVAADSLQARIDAVENDPEALERLARERYNLRRPGEEVLLLVPEEPKR